MAFQLCLHMYTGCLLPVKTEVWNNRMHLTESTANCFLSAVKGLIFSPCISLHMTWEQPRHCFTEWFSIFYLSQPCCILYQAKHDGNPSLPAAGSISPSLWTWQALITLHRNKKLTGTSPVGFTTRWRIEKKRRILKILIFPCSCRKPNTRVIFKGDCIIWRFLPLSLLCLLFQNL